MLVSGPKFSLKPSRTDTLHYHALKFARERGMVVSFDLRRIKFHIAKPRRK